MILVFIILSLFLPIDSVAVIDVLAKPQLEVGLCFLKSSWRFDSSDILRSNGGKSSKNGWKFHFFSFVFYELITLELLFQVVDDDEADLPRLYTR